jgi:hypothetical protein
MRQRKELYFNLTIKASAISTAPGIQKTIIPLITIFLQKKVKYWFKEIYPFQVYDNQKAAFSQENKMSQSGQIAISNDSENPSKNSE